MTDVEVTCRPVGQDWTCDVAIAMDGRVITRHLVTVAAADLERLDPGAREPHLLVDASFRFLLEREPPTSILRSFDLLAIEGYFPEYGREIRRRLGDRRSA